VVIKRDVQKGQYDFEFIHMNRIKKEFKKWASNLNNLSWTGSMSWS
jgi:hypothetical protein